MVEIIRLVRTGGVEGLVPAAVDLAAPGPGEIRLRQTAAGVNFVDIYHRIGLYPLPLPAVPGVEGVGIVTAVGPDAAGIAVGDRVAYAGAVGGYAAERLLPAWRAVAVPPDMPDAVAATLLARGITAEMLTGTVYPVGPGSSVLVQGAAGGLGSLLARWAAHRGARVIGTVGSQAKAAVARAAGAADVIVGRDADFPAEVMALTGGRGVDVAYDGAGGAVLAKMLGCVRPFGVVASIGQAAGPIPPLDVEDLGPRRSLSLARPSVMAYMADPDRYRAAAAAALAMAAEGVVPLLGHGYALAEAGQAQADLEAGRTTGCLYLTP